MKKIITLILLALLLIAAITACKKPVDGVNIDRALLLFVGETKTITPAFVPPDASNQNITWESSDPKVAIVNNGKVTGKTIGRAIITVKTQDNGRTAKCFVSICQPIEPEMVWVEGGTFTMGCTDEQGDDCFDSENPSHQVTLSNFYIGKYVVTQKEWVAVMGGVPYDLIKEGDNLPIHNITMEQIQTYINRLNAYTGKNYRLPTEAEWEYAARGGQKSKGYKYSGSDNANSVAWHYDNIMVIGPQPVGTKQPNELGIYDMSGNVYEMCSGWYGAYTSAPQTNPIGATTGTNYINRGGAWHNVAWFCRVSHRGYPLAGYQYASSGFRLVLSEK